MRVLIILAFLSIKVMTDEFFYFIPPKNWALVDPKKLPSSTTIAFVCKLGAAIKPSINLGIEPTDLSLENYLKIAKKKILLDRRNSWKELCYLKTPMGEARISQIEQKHECGDLISMQYILIAQKKAFVITALCLKDDYPTFSQDFLKTFESFQLTQNALASLQEIKDQKVLLSLQTKITDDWKKYVQSSKKESKETLFNSKTFQKKFWQPLEAEISKSFKDKGLFWQSQTAHEIKVSLKTSFDN